MAQDMEGLQKAEIALTEMQKVKYMKKEQIFSDIMICSFIIRNLSLHD